MAASLDADHRLAGDGRRSGTAGAGPPIRRARLRVGAASGAARGSRAWASSGRRSSPSASSTSAALVASCSSRRSGRSTRSPAQLVHHWTLDNYREHLLAAATRRTCAIAGRTIGIAAAVTITDAVLAFPLAYFMARVAPPRLRGRPLRRGRAARSGRATSSASTPGRRSCPAAACSTGRSASSACPPRTSPTRTGRCGSSSRTSGCRSWCCPCTASLERIPHSYIEASRDLGARGSRTLRSVILPLALPGIVAGSIFTFSLTLGDFITPLLIGGTGSSFIGNVVYENIGINAEHPVRRRARDHPRRRDGRLPRDRAPPRRVRGACDGDAHDPHRPLDLDRPRARVPVDPARADRRLRVQQVERAELADPRLDDALVPRRVVRTPTSADSLRLSVEGRR